MNRSAGRWLGWLLAAASVSGAAGCGREPLPVAPPRDGGAVGSPAGPSRSADAGVPAPDADAAGQATDAGASLPLAYVRACDAGLTRAAAYTLVPDGLETAYHRCGELGEVATGVRISRDGRRLAVVAAESVRLFDTATWREIARFAHAAEPVDAAAFSPDGTRLATVSSYIGQVALWDTSDGHAVAIFPGTVASTSQLARGSGVAFSSDGRLIATSMGTIIDTATGTSTNVGNNVIRDGQNMDLWFTADDTGLLARTIYHTGDSWVGTVIERFDSATGAREGEAGILLSGDLTQSVGVGDQWNPQYYVVDVSRAPPVTELSLPLSMIPSVDWEHTFVVALDHHGDLLALSNGTQLSIVETLHPDHEVTLIPLPAGAAVVGVSPADELVASGPSGTIAWDWRSGQVRWTQPFTVRTISWTADGSVAVATGPGALFRMWRTDTGAVLCAPPAGPGRVTDRVFSADGSKVLVRYDDATSELRRADLSNPQPVALAAVGTAKPVALANDGSAVAVWADQPLAPGAAPTHRLEVRRLDGSLVGAGPQDTSGVLYRAAVSPDLTRALYASGAGLTLVDVGGETTIASFDSGPALLGFSADGTRFALGVTDGIATYSSGDGTAGPIMRPADQPVAGWQLSADWSVALSYATSDGKAPYPTQLVRWAPPDGPAQSLLATDGGGTATLSTDGALIIRAVDVFHEFTGDYYDTIVRDAVTGALLQRFSDHPVTPSADGRRLFGNDGAVFCRSPSNEKSPALPGL